MSYTDAIENIYVKLISNNGPFFNFLRQYRKENCNDNRLPVTSIVVRVSSETVP